MHIRLKYYPLAKSTVDLGDSMPNKTRYLPSPSGIAVDRIKLYFFGRTLFVVQLDSSTCAAGNHSDENRPAASKH